MMGGKQGGIKNHFLSLVWLSDNYFINKERDIKSYIFF